MLSATALILLATAFAAGVTGAWSPCGFSMVETLGSARGHAGARAVRASCATFALGALAGGAITFTALAAIGSALGGAGSTAALVVAATIALAAAAGELLGVRIVPQIRRQVPERWRRTMPLPLAAGLYGVLLGLGFTTFVLTLAVWALAGISVAVGSVEAGLLIGLGFGAGRALPVVLMAPRYATLGQRLELKMAERPALLRRLRLVDGALLTALTVAFLASGSAQAAAGGRAVTVAEGATDPSIATDTLAWRQLDGRVVVVSGDVRSELLAENVAIGGPYVATRTGERIEVRDRATGALVAQRTAPGATQLAVSAGWLVWRTTLPGGGDRLYAAALPSLAGERVVAGLGRRERIGRPALDGALLAYATATRRESRIVVQRLDGETAPAQHRRAVLSTRLAELSQPALRGRRLLFVHATHCSQRLRVVRVGQLLRDARTLLHIGTTAHRDRGHEHGRTTQGREPGQCARGTPPRTDTVLWTTALGGEYAYVTLLRPAAGADPATATLARVGI
ncbi:MAG TPA: hypothetical protein VK506_15110 [Conexibacter sp.]|nr:hypothetical protein [Conexibacter sp.]